LPEVEGKKTMDEQVATGRQTGIKAVGVKSGCKETKEGKKLNHQPLQGPHAGEEKYR